MDAGLMEKEEMSKLGFSKRPRKNVSSTAYQKSKESKGFIAGLNK